MLCWCLDGGRAAFFFFFILFVIGDFVWSGLRKNIGDLGWFFFFCCCGLVVVVVVAVTVAVTVADGRSDCGWCCECFLSWIYNFIVIVHYFIVIFILFYCVES